MSKKIKIAIYSGVIPSTTFIERLISGITSNDFEVYLFGNQEKRISYPKNVKVIAFSNKLEKVYILVKYSILLTFFKSSEKKKLDGIIKKKNGSNIFLKTKYYPVLYHKPDIFHLQWAKSLSDWIWVKEFGIKLILSLRGTHITISPKCNTKLDEEYKNLFPKIDGFHAVSKSMIQHAEEYKVSKEKVSVVYNGLILEDFPFTQKKEMIKPLKIVSVGRAHWVKGYNYALETMALLKGKDIDFEYQIVGISDNEELIFLRNQLSLNKEVSFISKMTMEEVKLKIQEADILLLPSVEEGIANVVLEAMALGTLVVTTNCGGLGEVITDRMNGFVTPIRDCESMAEKIQTIASLSQEEYSKIVQNARYRIEQQHSESMMIEGVTNLYKRVFNENE